MTEHAQPQQEELKKHGDELEHALNSSGQRGTDRKPNEPASSGKKKE